MYNELFCDLIVECHAEKQWPVSEDSKPQTCSYLPAQCFGTE